MNSNTLNKGSNGFSQSSIDKQFFMPNDNKYFIPPILSTIYIVINEEDTLLASLSK